MYIRKNNYIVSQLLLNKNQVGDIYLRAERVFCIWESQTDPWLKFLEHGARCGSKSIPLPKNWHNDSYNIYILEKVQKSRKLVYNENNLWTYKIMKYKLSFILPLGKYIYMFNIHIYMYIVGDIVLISKVISKLSFL